MAEEREFIFEDWLAEGIKGFRTRCKELRPFLPEEFRQHTKAARQEMLLAMRSLVDAAIEYTEKEPEPKKRRATKVEVE
jgi:predicted amino acid dehydrogenase